MEVLVDTSVWSLALRRRAGALSERERVLREELAELIQEGRVVMIGPVRQELLSGISDPTVFQGLQDRLRAFDDAPLIMADYEEAARIHNQCRMAGVTGSAVDFLICAVALRRDLRVFTNDADFQRYAVHVPLQLHVPHREIG